ncbi:ATP-dependent nuclease [Collinsella ihumii]|uniref:ATP-dependent nuclease n=1 Tax=Collinsella ihumii TaxID=1720204 RepID=UPI00082F12EC|nr:AAA family ATPase [Collinsella ihumii]
MGADGGIYLRKIRIKGFKRFRDVLTVDFNAGGNVLVGDNGAGKSTILEAINLALSGRFRNEPIGRAISPYLFNTEDVAQFIKASGTSECDLPVISIEVFLGNADSGGLVNFVGAVNSDRSRQAGFTFRIGPSREYADDLIGRVRAESFDSLPIEYYTATWETFSRALVSPVKLPIRSAFINPGGEWGSVAVDERAVKSIIDCLDPEICRSIAGDVRSSRDNLASADGLARANGSIGGIEILGGRTAKLSAKQCSRESWIRDLTVQAGDVPFAHMGSGSQGVLQTRVALERHPFSKRATVILYEEPENHLSHAHLRELMDIVLQATGSQTVFSTHSSFVANKLDLGNLLLVPAEGGGGCMRFSDLSKSTREYFEKLAGFDTLRVVLADRSILVEGPSDELIVQKLYMDYHNGKMPLDDGIDVISVKGLSFKRFLDLAKLAGKRVAVVTDNDGHPEKVAEKYKDYSQGDGIKICTPSTTRTGDEGDGVKSWNTLEPELSRENGWERLASILGYACSSEAELVKHMEAEKTECALGLFKSDSSITCPEYIREAMGWVA